MKEEYNLNYKAIGIDPHNADGFIGELEKFGCPVICITQSCRELNDATEDMQLLIKGQKIKYNKANELLTWSASNAIIVENSFGERKIDKKLGQKKKRIDPIDAIIDAHKANIKLMASEKPEIDINKSVEGFLNLFG